MKNKSKLIRIGLTIIVGLILYYVWLPPINLQDPSLYVYLVFLIGIYAATGVLSILDGPIIFKSIGKMPRKITLFSGSIIAVFILIISINFILSPLFNSKGWSKRINIMDDKNFTDNIEEVDFNKVPLLDKASSQKLGDRVMGQMSELVSQYYVSDLYTQINYNSEIVRVTPLEYNGFIKWLNNKKHGTKGYIKVDSVTGKAKLIKLDKGMKYVPSAYFSKDLTRKLRFTYPTTIFGNYSFEIDNQGNPYWVIPTIKYIGIGSREDINGVILLNPINGKSKKYKINEVPTWVDQVFSANLIINQINSWGMYKKGFFNSIFSQNGVVQTTEGYNYLVHDDDVYMYTGITSVSTDESNIGFVLTNLRTKETNFYQVPGAEEYSAMASAEGQVQQMKYSSSFPLLINLNNRPTYLISLKDNAGLVKMYAFVDVVDYQKVVVTDSTLGINTAAENYLNSVNLSSGDSKEIKINEKEIIISTINTAVIDNNTYYYIKDSNNQKYKTSIKTNNNLLPFLKSGDKVTVEFYKEQEVIEIIKIK